MDSKSLAVSSWWALSYAWGIECWILGTQLRRLPLVNTALMILLVLHFLREKNETHSRIWGNSNLGSQRHGVERLWGKEMGEGWELLGFFHWHLALGHHCWVRRSQGVQVSPELVSDWLSTWAELSIMWCRGESACLFRWVWSGPWLYPEEKWTSQEESKLRVCLQSCQELFFLQIMLCCCF